MNIPVKQEIIDPSDNLDATTQENIPTSTAIIPITTGERTDNRNLDSSNFHGCNEDIDEEISPLKKMKLEADAQPLGFHYMDPKFSHNETGNRCKQFWKAGDYEEPSVTGALCQTVGMDHVRVHPKFLHSNATSHKWALGAFAELLDNAMDEVCNGATYVSVDVLDSKKVEGAKMLLFEDNGGGMTPDKMRQCMSLGYSAKSKQANTIGQYGNGFKTSSMRLGADVIVFSRTSTTQSIGMLSYTFLTSTGKEDIVVPMVDCVKSGETWDILVRSSVDDWKRNLETIVHWSPFESESDLFWELEFLKDQGTRIIVYNLWENEEGLPELDFDSDSEDIQIRGDRDKKIDEMANEYPNSRHFLTYQHSLRSYASILYLKLAPGFQIILRGKDVEHHNLVDDMMMSEEIMYRPSIGNHETKVTLGFVKDAKHHIDIQGFNVYHKNRLIKAFWRVWNPAGSDGRGVIGLLEANFIEPAHDKQGFERTIGLARLEARLQIMQKRYWTTNCHLIGYAKRRHVKNSSNVSHPPEKQTPEAGNDATKGKLQQALLDLEYEREKNKRLEEKLKDAEKIIVKLLKNAERLEGSGIKLSCKTEPEQ